MLEKKPDKKVLLIGWDAADWKVINPLIDDGKMPNLQSLIEGGVMGNLATLQPVLSPMLWSSIATGKRPYKHGIYGFSEPDPVTGGIRPVTNLSRKTKAIWNILNQEEKKTLTVGWWPSNPAETLSKGIMVSNDYQTAHGDGSDLSAWPMKPNTVHPEELTDMLKELRFHPAEVTEEDIFHFMPELLKFNREELDKVEKDPRLQSLTKTIADCTSIHSAATALMASKPWDFAAVYYDAIDHFGHAFMKYHPPQREGIDDWDYKLFHYVNEAGYRYHDMMLGTLVGIAREIDPQVTIILMSDHGFHPDDLRVNHIPNEPAGPAAEHRQFGIFVANGPGIRKDGRIYGAGLLDICPTLLHLCGLPVGEDMDGKVLLDIYENPPLSIDRIPSWDEVDGDHGMHSPDKQISAEDSKAALDQLVALGYIDEPDKDQSKALEQTVRELDYNLAQAWIDGGVFSEAIVILQRLYEKWPLEHRFGFQLSRCYQSLGRIPELRSTISIIIERRLKDAEEAIATLQKLNLEDEAVQKAEEQRVEKMTEVEKKKYTKERQDLIRSSRPNLLALRYLEANADIAEKKYEDALEKLNQLDDNYGARIQALNMRGEALAKLRRWEEAAAAYEEALKIDQENPGPLLGLARVCLAEKKYEEAISYARASLGLLFFQPRAHYMVAVAHYKLGQIDKAEQVFQLCVRQAPLFASAWRMLAEIAQQHKYEPSKAFYYKTQLKEARARFKKIKEKKSFSHVYDSLKIHTELQDLIFENSTPVNDEKVITIVSGLPRSGTSLMMQMLEEAGIPIFTDNKRRADESNTKGYYEHDLVSGLFKRNTSRSWLEDAKGKALKVVAPLLSSLPQKVQIKDTRCSSELRYRIIFMEREMEEVIDSQCAMLKRLGKDIPSGNVSHAYQQQVNHAMKWVNRHQISAISIRYEELVHDPVALTNKVAHFLRVEDKAEKMRSVIDPAMHRARFSKGQL